MVTIKFYTEKCLEAGAILLPTILVEVPAKTNFCLAVVWLKWGAAIELEWTKKAKIAANENKNK